MVDHQSFCALTSCAKVPGRDSFLFVFGRGWKLSWHVHTSAELAFCKSIEDCKLQETNEWQIAA